MTNKNDTSSLKAMLSKIAISAVGITTTLNTSGMIYDSLFDSVVYESFESDFETTTPTVKINHDVLKTNYDMAMDLFPYGMRDFTKDEAEKYKLALAKIYKPIGVNVLDLC